MTLYSPPPSIDSIIARSTEFILGKWWSRRKYDSTTIPILKWTEGDSYGQELQVRGGAMAGFVLAVPGFLNTASMWEQPPSVVKNCGARLIASVARQHASNHPVKMQSWGGSWQSPLWAAWCGLAAMCGWDDLIPNQTERNNVLNMLVSEANFVCTRPVEFWRNADDSPGTNTLNPNDGGLRTGNSACEELSWNAAVLWVAQSLMPTHQDAPAWFTQAVKLNIAAFASKADLGLAPYLTGYNIDANDLVTNHDRIHPDYMTTATQSVFGYVARGLVGLPVPIDTMWNFALVWRALQLSPMDASGTKAYNSNVATVQFPASTPASDWGARRPAPYACFDGLMDLFLGDCRLLLGQDVGAVPLPPAWWLAVHAENAAAMQARDGTTTHPPGSFVDTAVRPEEATYPEEDVYAASQFAFLRLAQYLRYNRANLWI